MSIESRVIETVRIQMGLAQGVVTSQSHIVNDLGGDSLDEVEVLMGIEDEFEIEISDYDAGKINTVQDAIDYITKRIA